MKLWYFFLLLSAGCCVYAKTVCDGLEKYECLAYCNCAMCVTDVKSICIPQYSGEEQSPAYANCLIDHQVEVPIEGCTWKINETAKTALITAGVFVGIILLCIIVVVIYISCDRCKIPPCPH